MKKILSIALLLALVPTLSFADGFHRWDRDRFEDRGRFFRGHDRDWDRPVYYRHRLHPVAYAPCAVAPAPVCVARPVVYGERPVVIDPVAPVVAPVLGAFILGAAIDHALVRR